MISSVWVKNYFLKTCRVSWKITFRCGDTEFWLNFNGTPFGRVIGFKRFRLTALLNLFLNAKNTSFYTFVRNIYAVFIAGIYNKFWFIILTVKIRCFATVSLRFLYINELCYDWITSTYSQSSSGRYSCWIDVVLWSRVVKCYRSDMNCMMVCSQTIK